LWLKLKEIGIAAVIYFGFMGIGYIVGVLLLHCSYSTDPSSRITEIWILQPFLGFLSILLISLIGYIIIDFLKSNWRKAGELTK